MMYPDVSEAMLTNYMRWGQVPATVANAPGVAKRIHSCADQHYGRWAKHY